MEIILVQDMCHSISQMEYFGTDRKNTPIAVRSPSGWLLSGPLSSTLGLFSKYFTAVTQKETDSKSSDRMRRWYGMEPHGA